MNIFARRCSIGFLIAFGGVLCSPVARADEQVHLRADWYAVTIPYRYVERERYQAGWHRGADVRVLDERVRSVTPGVVQFVGTVAGRHIATVVDSSLGATITYVGLQSIAVHPGQRLVTGTIVGRASDIHIGAYDVRRRSKYFPVVGGDSRTSAPDMRNDDSALSAVIVRRLSDAVSGSALAGVHHDAYSSWLPRAHLLSDAPTTNERTTRRTAEQRSALRFGAALSQLATRSQFPSGRLSADAPSEVVTRTSRQLVATRHHHALGRAESHVTEQAVRMFVAAAREPLRIAPPHKALRYSTVTPRRTWSGRSRSVRRRHPRETPRPVRVTREARSAFAARLSGGGSDTKPSMQVVDPPPASLSSRAPRPSDSARHSRGSARALDNRRSDVRRDVPVDVLAASRRPPSRHDRGREVLALSAFLVVFALTIALIRRRTRAPRRSVAAPLDVDTHGLPLVLSNWVEEKSVENNELCAVAWHDSTPEQRARLPEHA
ncbi:MAG: hypothetical protein JWN41_188 [Thermoleophilia bacterium]|nr:hypothetical protein [Thermoleophilia bacterium]